MVVRSAGGPRTPATRHEVTFVRGAAFNPPPFAKPTDGGDRRRFRHLRLPDGADYLRWAGLCEFLITRDGRRIDAHPLAPLHQDTFQAYLLGQALSFALIRLGLEPLHATAVAFHGKAIALLGDGGTGKSTLAAACLKAGHRVLTDDLLVLKPLNGRIVAYPGQPQIKLMPSVARSLLGPQARGAPLHPLTAKRIIPLVPRQFADRPLPLHGFYVLRPRRARSSSRVVIRRLPMQAAWLALIRGTFNALVRDADRLKAQFEWVSALVQRMPVKALSYPRSLRLLPTLVETLASETAGCGPR